MKYTKSALGLLNARYRSVLKKCLLINLGLFALATPAMALDPLTPSQYVPDAGSNWSTGTAKVNQWMSDLADQTAWTYDTAVTGWGVESVLGILTPALNSTDAAIAALGTQGTAYTDGPLTGKTFNTGDTSTDTTVAGALDAFNDKFVTLDGSATTAGSIKNTISNVIAEGATNGTIAVNGTDVKVHGLGTAAYVATATSPIAAASTDTSLVSAAQVATFVEGKGYQTAANVTAAIEAAAGDGLEKKSDGVLGVKAADKSVTVGAGGVAVNVYADGGLQTDATNGLKIKSQGVTSDMIKNGTIVGEDISSSAALSVASVTTTGKASVASLALGGTDISATAAEINLLSGMTAVDGTTGTGNTTLATVATVTDKINNAAGAGLTSSSGVINVAAADKSITVNADNIAVNVYADGGLQTDTTNGLQIKDKGVTTAKIADGAVTTDQLGAKAVTTAKIADGAVTTDQLANNAVTSAKIADHTITGDDIATDAALSVASVTTTGKVTANGGADVKGDLKLINSTDASKNATLSVDANGAITTGNANINAGTGNITSTGTVSGATVQGTTVKVGGASGISLTKDGSTNTLLTGGAGIYTGDGNISTAGSVIGNIITVGGTGGVSLSKNSSGELQIGAGLNTAGNAIKTEGGNITTTTGSIATTTGSISTVSGDITSTSGSITTSSGNITTTSGTVTGAHLAATTDLKVGGANVITGSGATLNMGANALTNITTISSTALTTDTTSGTVSIGGAGYTTTVTGDENVTGALTAGGSKFQVDNGGTIQDVRGIYVSNGSTTAPKVGLTVTNSGTDSILNISDDTKITGTFGAGTNGTEFTVDGSGNTVAAGTVKIGGASGATLTGTATDLTSDKKVISANGFEVTNTTSLLNNSFTLNSKNVTTIDDSGTNVASTVAAATRKATLATAETVYSGAENALYDGTKLAGSSAATIKTALTDVSTTIGTTAIGTGTGGTLVGSQIGVGTGKISVTSAVETLNATNQNQNTAIGALNVDGTYDNTVLSDAMFKTGGSTAGATLSASLSNLVTNTKAITGGGINATTGAVENDYATGLSTAAADYTALTNDSAIALASAVGQINKNIGTAAQLSNAYNGVATSQTVNTNLNAINGTIGNITTLATDAGGSVGDALSNGGGASAKPTTVVQALNNIDATLGNIHGLRAQLEGPGGTTTTSAGSNLQTGTTVEDHLTSLDAAIGNRTGIGSANARINTSTATSVAAGLKATGDAIGDMNFASAHYYNDTSANANLSEAVRTLDSNMYRIDNELRDLRHDFNSGMASLAAMSALVPNPRSSGDTSLSLGTGAYNGHTAMAFGGFHYITDNVLLNAGAAWGNSKDMSYRLGVTWSF